MDGVNGDFLTWCTWMVGPEGVVSGESDGDCSKVMVPVSDGWPPPCTWKMVDGVVRIYGCDDSSV